MKVILITGASAGIGEAFAKRLASEKHNLLLVARSEDKLKLLCEELAAKHNINAQYVAIDLTQANASRTIFEETEKRGLQIDWLINNAGIGSGGDLLEYSLESVINMMHLNMDAMVALTHLFLPQMRARKGGKIINVGSMAGFGPIPYMNVYAATKAFVRSFTEALWEENRLYNIQVMLLCPGSTETKFFDAAQIHDDRKKSFSSFVMETSEQVVESAMKGLNKKKMIAISGTHNKIARLLYLIPNAIVLPLFGNKMRKELNLHTKTTNHGPRPLE